MHHTIYSVRTTSVPFGGAPAISLLARFHEVADLLEARADLKPDEVIAWDLLAHTYTGDLEDPVFRATVSLARPCRLLPGTSATIGDPEDVSFLTPLATVSRVEIGLEEHLHDGPKSVEQLVGAILSAWAEGRSEV